MNPPLTARLKAAIRRWLDVRPEATRTRLCIVCPRGHTLIEPHPTITLSLMVKNPRVQFYCAGCSSWYNWPLAEGDAERYERVMAMHKKDLGRRVG